MLKRLKCDGIALPKLYIASSKKDIDEAKDLGIPYIVWKRSQDELLRLVLRPILEKMFPHILWDRVLGPQKKFKTEVNICKGGQTKRTELSEQEAKKAMEDFDRKIPKKREQIEDESIELSEQADISDSENIFSGASLDDPYEKLNLLDYVGDSVSSVDLDVLQKLGMLPSFIGDISDCIKTNLSERMRWNEGYTKKLGVPIGNFNRAPSLRNLIILDISGSIPRGISATMITLIDTLRNQANADLIITSSISKFYPYGTELPSPQDIRDTFGYDNEDFYFFQIMSDHVFGHEWGHVISFGDYDSPDWRHFVDMSHDRIANTKVHHVHHYHTRARTSTGYGVWCDRFANPDTIDFDRSWCNIIER